MKKLIHDTTGSISILSIGFIFLLLLLTFLVVEMGSTYENYDYCMDVLQRSCNSAVECNIDDSYRADKILLLNTDGARSDFLHFVASDLSDRYRVSISSIQCSTMPPSMTVKGTATFSTLFEQFGWDDLNVPFTIRATNYDLK